MNPNEFDLETQLRTAPRPRPPASLREQLIAQAPANGRAGNRKPMTPISFWRRWWPALAPAAASAACAVWLGLQQIENHDLQESIKALAPAAVSNTVSSSAAPTSASPIATTVETESDEISRLKETVKGLQDEIAQLERLEAENQSLRAQLSAPQSNVFTAEEQAKLDRARERAQAINCVNNLKQIGLAARVFGLDHQDNYPPDLLSMSNELSTPKILVCAADTNRPVAPDWASYSTANCSYEYLAPEGSAVDPTRILTRCPIHGSIGLCDGSVMIGVAKTHPEAIVTRNGKLYYEPGQQNPITK